MQTTQIRKDTKTTAEISGKEGTEEAGSQRSDGFHKGSVLHTHWQKG